MKQLFCDCKTDEEKANFFLSGRAVETGIIAPAISNDVSMAYHRCAEFQKEIDTLRAKIARMERQDCSKQSVPAEVPREFVMDAIAQALGDAYDCTRVWSAWGYGTMSQDDFHLIAEDGDRLSEIADAAIMAMGASAPKPYAQPAPSAVAYLDLGAGGYMDIGTDLTDEELDAIPKGRHMLGIVGTYGIEGYVPAQPATSVPDGFAWPECPKRRQSHVLFDDGYEEGWAACVATIKAALAAPEAKP